jgi:hypothetical protein
MDARAMDARRDGRGGQGAELDAIGGSGFFAIAARVPRLVPGPARCSPRPPSSAVATGGQRSPPVASDAAVIARVVAARARGTRRARRSAGAESLALPWRC